MSHEKKIEKEKPTFSFAPAPYFFAPPPSFSGKGGLEKIRYLG